MQTTASPVVVRTSRPGLGRGLFANERIPAGVRIVEYTGKRIPTPVADRLTTRYLFEIDKRWTVDAEDKRHIARYINHACEPNAEARLEAGRIFIHAARDIATGEEITIDYGNEYFDEFIRPLGCGCKKCSIKAIR